jgi:hypothetical protein
MTSIAHWRVSNHCAPLGPVLSIDNRGINGLLRVTQRMPVMVLTSAVIRRIFGRLRLMPIIRATPGTSISITAIPTTTTIAVTTNMCDWCVAESGI